MTIRDIANYILDLQWYWGFILFLILAFVGSFFSAMGKDTYEAVAHKDAQP